MARSNRTRIFIRRSKQCGALDGVKLSAQDWAGAGVALIGMSIIVLGWHDKT